uniref:Ig-like domain-containing protein n=1 Tax=Coturnix japonica TaxID=93934 RepID=A0A8C2UHA0_COTJA
TSPPSPPTCKCLRSCAGTKSSLLQQENAEMLPVPLSTSVNSYTSFFFPEVLSNPRLTPLHGTLEVVMYQNVSLSCHSDSGSPPIRYTLFKQRQQVSALNRTDLTPVVFNLTINSASDLGEYKCKAENEISNGEKYSRSLNFTLKGMSCCIDFQHILFYWIQGRNFSQQRVEVNSSSYILKVLTYHGKYTDVTLSKLEGERLNSLTLEPCRRCY